MEKTLIINPIFEPIKKGAKKKVATRKTKPKVVYRTRRSKLDYTKLLIYTLLGLGGTAALQKVLNIPQKYLVGVGGSVALLALGRKYPKEVVYPIAAGMGAAGIMGYLSNLPAFQGIFSDYFDIGRRPGMKLLQDYWKNPHMAGLKRRTLDFADMQ